MITRDITKEVTEVKYKFDPDEIAEGDGIVFHNDDGAYLGTVFSVLGEYVKVCCFKVGEKYKNKHSRYREGEIMEIMASDVHSGEVRVSMVLRPREASQ